jgi:hypothetical protein
MANGQALVAVEHAKTLRHIVDRTSHALIFEAQVAGKERRRNGRGQSSRKLPLLPHVCAGHQDLK